MATLVSQQRQDEAGLRVHEDAPVRRCVGALPEGRLAHSPPPAPPSPHSSPRSDQPKPQPARPSLAPPSPSPLALPLPPRCWARCRTSRRRPTDVARRATTRTKAIITAIHIHIASSFAQTTYVGGPRGEPLARIGLSSCPARDEGRMCPPAHMPRITAHRRVEGPAQNQAASGGLRQTETWLGLSEVKGDRSQSAHRPTNSSAASLAIRSHSAGQMYRKLLVEWR